MTSRRSLSPVATSLIALCLTSLILVACNSEAKRTADSSSVRAGATVGYDVTRFSSADFAILRWIEGDWRGQIASGGYFYERYKFADDSTIVMHGFEDSAFTQPNDSATIVFRGGVVIDRGPKAQWSATRLDAKGIDFAPIQGATNRFSWNRQSADKWTAAIRPAKAAPTVYPMERVRPK
jgi:hypothetical protein